MARIQEWKGSGQTGWRRGCLWIVLDVHRPRSSSHQEDVLDRPRILSPMCPRNYHHLSWPSCPESRHPLIMSKVNTNDRVMSSLKCQGKQREAERALTISIFGDYSSQYSIKSPILPITHRGQSINGSYQGCWSLFMVTTAAFYGQSPSTDYGHFGQKPPT